MGIQLEQAFRQLAIIEQKVAKATVSLNINVLRKDLAVCLNLLSDALQHEFDPQGHPDQKFGSITYSQHGEDLMILNLFQLMGINKPSYLDLGAHDPLNISNTALLYARGSRGINVEANPLLMPRFKEFRPLDINLNVGVGTKPGTAKFYMYSDTSGRNTFSPHEVKTMEGILSVVQEIELPVMTLNEIIEEHYFGKFPDLLTCDIEGLDFEVLSTLPAYSVDIEMPKIIIVEVRKHNSERMRNLMAEKGYWFVLRMGENLLFIRKELSRHCV